MRIHLMLAITALASTMALVPAQANNATDPAYAGITPGTIPSGVASSTSSGGKPPVASTIVPEPADAALFGAGVLGLIIGRWGAKRRSRRHD
jgi:hypothetical protein